MVVGPGGSEGSGGSQHGKRRGKSSTRATESSTRHESGDEEDARKSEGTDGDDEEKEVVQESVTAFFKVLLGITKHGVVFPDPAVELELEPPG